MKPTLKILSFLLAFSLMATGCGNSIAEGNPSSTGATSSGESTSSTLTPPGDENSIETQAKALEMLLTYGATQEEDGTLTPHRGMSLFYAEDWDAQHPLSPDAYMSWNLNRMWSSNSTLEEREARYSPPDDGGGWFFPESEYENEAQRYFDVIVETLRASSHYEGEHHGYRSPPGGMGQEPTLQLHRVETTGDGQLELHLTLVYDPTGQVDGRQPAAEYKILTVEENGTGYRFLSFKTDPNPSPEQQAAAITTPSPTPTAAGSRYENPALGIALTLPEGWAGH